MFSSQTLPQNSPEIRAKTKEDKGKRPRGCQSDSAEVKQEVTQEGWSSEPQSCSQAVGCDTPDRHPGPSRPG